MEQQFASLHVTDEGDHISPDWASLPNDVLHRIFSKVFEIPPRHPFQPLKGAILQAEALHLTCKNWSTALLEQPPPLALQIQTPSEYNAARWITKFPVKSLLFAQEPPLYPDDDSDESYDSDDSDAWETDTSGGDDPDHILGIEAPEYDTIDISHDWYGLPIDCVHNSINGLCLGELQRLEFLHINCPRTHAPGTNIFYSEPIESLQHLSHLILVEFDDFKLLNLPCSVRTLVIAYPERLDELLDSFTMCPHLPDTLTLDKFHILSACELGIALDELWNTCAIIRINARCCLVGVPVSDPEIVRVFERPYREGRYVPPHILGDSEALEASSKASDQTIDYMLRGLASSAKTEILQFSEGASRSLKLVPGKMGNCRSSVEFLHSVCRDKVLYLYGVDVRDIVDRLDFLELFQQLPNKELDWACNAETGDFRITVENIIAGKKGAEVMFSSLVGINS